MNKIEKIEKIILENKKYCLVKKDNVLYFVEQAHAGFTGENNDVLINKLKLFFKRCPGFFNLLYNLIGAFYVGKSAKRAITDVGDDKIILNLGSGVKKIRADVINVDFYPFAGVDIVVDIGSLPFVDNSVDAVINEYVLEHVPNSEKIVSEIHRVLKPGGLFYLTVPFVATFHSSPNDFFRWSKRGVHELTKNFQEVELGVRCGSSSAFVYVASEWLGTVLSFGWLSLQQTLFMFFMVLFIPIKFLDFLICKYPSNENAAYGFYFIGRKL